MQDTGAGIDAADMVRVFQAFRQSAARAGQPAEGAGLGLTIARDIAQAMGGDISLRSRLGVGTAFCSRRACRRRAAAAKPAAQPARRHAARPHRAAGRARCWSPRTTTSTR